MPLLKGRFVIPVKPLTDVKPDETIYTIPHTNEQFRSREEYERRVALYKDTIWTCRCTGHISLTHEEARKSEEEKYSQLQLQFPEYFYKPVLMLVHHILMLVYHSKYFYKPVPMLVYHSKYFYKSVLMLVYHSKYFYNKYFYKSVLMLVYHSKYFYKSVLMLVYHSKYFYKSVLMLVYHSKYFYKPVLMLIHHSKYFYKSVLMLVYHSKYFYKSVLMLVYHSKYFYKSVLILVYHSKYFIKSVLILVYHSKYFYKSVLMLVYHSKYFYKSVIMLVYHSKYFYKSVIMLVYHSKYFYKSVIMLVYHSKYFYKPVLMLVYHSKYFYKPVLMLVYHSKYFYKPVLMLVYHSKYFYKPVLMLIHHSKYFYNKYFYKSVLMLVYHSKYFYKPVLMLVYHSKYFYKPVLMLIHHSKYFYKPVLMLIHHSKYFYKPVLKLIHHSKYFYKPVLMLLYHSKYFYKSVLMLVHHSKYFYKPVLMLLYHNKYFYKPVLMLIHHSKYFYKPVLILIHHSKYFYKPVLMLIHHSKYFYKPVLMLIHHSTEILDSLVVEAWTRLHQRLVVDEPVALKFKSQGNLIKGTVVRVESDVTIEPLKPGPVNGCSPSSDKENKDNTAGADQSDSPKKWTPIKLLPCKYNIRLQEGDTVISGVPSQDIVRLHRPPSKELIKLFIRAFAIRGGFQQNSPWSVQEDLVTKYSIPSKFADFLVSTSKMMEYGKKAMEEASKNLKKRKLSSHSESQSKKQKSDAKHDKSQEKKPSAKKQLMLKMKVGSPAKSGSETKDGTLKKTTPKKQNHGSGDHKTKDTHSPELDKLGSKLDSDELSSEDDISLATLKKSVDLTGADDSSLSSSEDENIALADLKPLNKLVDGKKHSVKHGSGKKSVKDAKKMKQMTLFDMKNKKKASSTPKKTSGSTSKSPMTSPKKSPYKQPPIVIRLLKAHRDDNKPLYYQLLSMCVRELSGVQRNRLPLSVKDDVIKRWKRKQEKKKVALMTPEQKEAYIAQKREELRKALKKKRAALNKRHEDTHLELKPLPLPKLVATPEPLPNELFGDVVMVTTFISCYRGLLMPEDDQPVSTDLLMKALVEGEKGFAYLSHVLVIMLQTLLQDGVAEGYMELAMPLADLPANLYTVSELVRLCLRHDDDVDSMSDEGIDDDEYMVSDAIIERLETCELYALEPTEKLEVLVGLCHRLMTTYSAQDFMTSRQQASIELWLVVVSYSGSVAREVIYFGELGAALNHCFTAAPKIGRLVASGCLTRDKLGKMCRQKNASLKEQKKTKTSGLDGQKKVAGKLNENNKEGSTEGLTITHFYGTKETEKESESPVIEEAASLAEVVKKRRLLAAKAIEEKAQREREEAERRRVEAEELKRQREEELFEKTFTEGIAQAKSVLRQCPIGTDRNHSRYWIFEGTTPGLYIEKGWVHESIGYRVRLVQDDDSSEDDSLLDFSSDCDSNFDGRRRKQLEMERTVPPVGQNLWFTYDSVDDIDALLKCLHPQGIRESSLQAEAQETLETSDSEVMSDGSKALVEGFRQEMSDLEGRLRSGGLGGVPNYDDWLNKLNSVSTIKEFGECLTLSQRSVCNKFITGILAKTVKKKPTAISVEPEDEQKEGEVKEETEEKQDDDVVYVGMQSWTDAIESCPTFSRLHLLLSIFDSCVKWEKSAENAKCKICRKKRCEDKLLLCDECNQAFHLYCLRPALYSVPPGDCRRHTRTGVGIGTTGNWPGKKR
ncbi:hypothetical protein NP493_90g03009 [Ridgeia piscesae]|uniref:Uncharacterized protein n=1 Tax=Ridgeia piscesae TaxID=27915 RepID=A0AAD9UHT8_RIDPI|nr:hypothetical protein NP493_90g03009 [Ridgeia piscesae]